jgi:hypothetical protein
VADVDLSPISSRLKQQYPELFATEFKNGAVFIWRPLSPYEYKAIFFNTELETWEKEHAFCDLCVVYAIVDNVNYGAGGYDFTRGYGGFATTLTGQILSNSGFGQDDVADKIFDEMREQMEQFENQIPCVIKLAFGSDVNFHEIETWSMRKIFYYLSRAEWMLNFQSQLYRTGGIPTPQIKQKQPVKPKIPREEWMNMEWEEITENEFNKIAPPDTHYDPEADPNLLIR